MALTAAKGEKVRTPMSTAGTKIPAGGKGFSLLELLVVLMLLAMLLAVVIPSVGRGVATVKLKTSSREIAAAIRLARSKAVREQQVYVLGFDTEKDEVELSSANSSYRKSFALPEGIRFKQAGLLEGALDRDEKTPMFYFMPNGNSQSFQVSIRNEQGRTFKVIQGSLTGTPKIEEIETDIETADE
jgi:general secretion pathway protein H